MNDISTIIVIDTESTGLEPSEGARLLEVAWVVLEKGPANQWDFSGPGSESSFMIAYDTDRYGPIPAEAKAVHHISEAEVHPEREGVIEFDELMHMMLNAESIGDTAYAAHNAPHDRKFLPELGNDTADGQPGVPWIDTVRCARHIWPDAPRYSNQVLRYWLGVEPPAHLLAYEGEPLAPHRALYDAAVTGAILKRLLEQASVETLIGLTNRPVLQTTVGFGVHRGKKWSDVPRSYLYWMQDKSDMLQRDEDLRHTVKHYLGSRAA